MSRRFVRLSIAALLATISAFSVAQTAPVAPARMAGPPTYSSESTNFIERWQARVSATQAQQPKWIAPVFSPFPFLVQLGRTEFTRQVSTTHATTWNLGSSRGLNLIPLKNTEIDILIPPFFEHDTKAFDGFGDFGLAGKYRLLSGNEAHGSYVVSALLNATVPTGSYGNGASDATLTPALSGGKGFGKVDAFTTLGGTLPTGGVKTIGRTINSNSVVQYHVQKYLWPELEINTTAYYGGTKDGKIQTFLTPAVMIGKYALRMKDNDSRLGVAAGAGFQVAATTYHPYNHSLIFTSRIIF